MNEVSCVGRVADIESGRCGHPGFGRPEQIGRRWDCDESLREEVLAAPARVLAYEDYEGIADVVLLWWRAGDGNLSDALTDALIACAGQGTIWLLTPDTDQDGHVEASDIADGTTIARLSVTASFRAAPWWAVATWCRLLK